MDDNQVSLYRRFLLQGDILQAKHPRVLQRFVGGPLDGCVQLDGGEIPGNLLAIQIRGFFVRAVLLFSDGSIYEDQSFSETVSYVTPGSDRHFELLTGNWTILRRCHHVG